MLFIFTILTLFYHTTIGQAVVAMAPTVGIAALLLTSSFSFPLIF
jgi:hypothetical protein